MEASIKKETETFASPSQAESGDNKILSEVIKALSRVASGYPLKLEEYKSKPYQIKLQKGPAEGELSLEKSIPTNPLGLEIKIEKNGNQGDFTCTIKASGKVGAALLGTVDNGIPVIVKPKVDVDHLLYMVLWAYFKNIDMEKERPERTYYDREFLYIMPRFFLNEVNGLVTRLNKVLRRTYTERHEELKSRIKGRPELQLYIKHNLPKLKNQDMPCCWWELSKDNDYNRALKLGLHLCKRSMDFLQRHYRDAKEDRKPIQDNGDAREDIKPIQDIKQDISRLLKFFQGVTLDPQVAYRINRLRPVGNFRPYRKSIEILKYLLKHLDFNLHGDKFLVNGIVLDMHEIFEKCVVNYLAANLENPPYTVVSKKEEKERKIEIRSSLNQDQEPYSLVKNIVPDAVINRNEETHILDTKWKEAFEQKESEEEFIELSEFNLNIRNSDLYQMVAYGMHKDVKAKSAILVYPLEPSGSPPDRYEVVGFMGTKREYPIYITGIPMKGDLQKALNNFKEQVEDIWNGEYNQVPADD